ncbi:MAG: hypothetical protein VX642_01630 [Bdellovibrionota bacterium]|nr:hypothetical protein [Bdellovibrionota bacterium]
MKSISFDQFKIDNEKKFKKLPSDYLSVAIDMALIVGAGWWEGNQDFKDGRGVKKAQLLELKNAEIIKHFQALGDVTLRIGGTEADSVFYQFGNSKKPQAYSSVMTEKRFLEIADFVKSMNAKLFLTLNAGPANWDKDNLMKLSQVQKIVNFIRKHNISVEALELGNENNAFWVSHGLSSQLSTTSYFKNYKKVKDYLKKENIKLAGPANAFWPKIGEVAGFFTVSSYRFFKLAKSDLDLFTWHYYPSQSERCPVQLVDASKESFLSLKTHKRIEEYMSKIKKYRDKHSPNTPIWLGETGSAQCGGKAGVSDTYLSSLWWLNQLGLGALYSTEKQIRQSFVGADYALLNFKNLQPNPDYFASLIWKRLMGRRFFKISGEDKEVLSYAHCQKSTKGKIIKMFINFGSKKKLKFSSETEVIKLEAVNQWQQMAMNSIGLKSLEDFEKAFRFQKVNELDMRRSDIVFVKADSGLCN